jgi:predicted ATP-dependent endonuclease of OLD family
MAINRVEINDFLVFKGNFAMDFCPGVNVIIGGNATGKTTLLREMYKSSETHKIKNEDFLSDVVIKYTDGRQKIIPKESAQITFGVPQRKNVVVMSTMIENRIYIPEKDILEHARGLLPFIEEKQTGFSQIYKDVLIKAQDIPTQKQTETQKNIGKTISNIINGEVKWDQGDGAFYTIKTNGDRIPFANEASGFKKLGFLGLLVACGQLENGTVLFWDEPENSLNPELMSILAEILLILTRSGVQIFLATHSEILASYLDVTRKDGDKVMFYSLYKDGEQIKADKSERFEYLRPNKLTEEIVTLYKEQLKRGTKDGDR